MVHFINFVSNSMERKNRYHHRQCLNCGYKSQVVFRYCPRCGQENISIQVPFWDWLYDLTQNAFAVDSKLGKSLIPFLFKPGFLTLAFNTGHRAKYVNPFRLYLIMSLVLFSITSFDRVEEEESPGVEVNETIQLPFGIEAQTEDFSEGYQDGLKSKSETNLAERIKDSLSNNESEKFSFNFGFNPEDDKGWSKLFADSVLRKSKYYPRSNEEADSMLKWYGISDLFINRVLIKQGLKALHESDSLNQYAQSKLPSTIFFMLPFYTMLVQMVYSRRKFYYQEHLVHTFNIHSFLFLLISILYFVYLMNWVETFPLGLMLFVTIIHVYLSMRTVYLQNHWKTFLKFSLLGIGYTFVLMIAMVINIIISFLLF